MTETTQDAYVKGYNQGRADEAAQATLATSTQMVREAEGFPKVMLLPPDKESPVFKTPDLTAAQGVAIVGSLLAVAASFGFDLTTSQQSAVMQLVSIVAGVLLAGDAVIRHGRATGNAKKVD